MAVIPLFYKLATHLVNIAEGKAKFFSFDKINLLSLFVAVNDYSLNFLQEFKLRQPPFTRRQISAGVSVLCVYMTGYVNPTGAIYRGPLPELMGG